MPKIPQGFSTITPALNVNGADKAIKLYKKALGAKEDYRMETPDGKVMHACLQIGNSKLFLADVMPGMGCSTPSEASFYLYVDDVDGSYKKALQGGMSELYPVNDMFWGDRTGSVKDSFGIIWTLATHVREVSPEDMEEGKKQFMSKAA